MRTRRQMAAVLVAVLVAGATAWVGAAAPVGAAEQFRPAGLDPDWPACRRANGFGIDSVGCAVDDVPGGVANADRYVFVHGKAYRPDGQTIQNINAISPFGQSESIGHVSVGDHTGEDVGLMKSGEGGWWGVWVPVKRTDETAVPPVRAWIAPLNGYGSFYPAPGDTPPTPPPFGVESDLVGLGSGNRAVRVDDLTMPGPAQIIAPCEQRSYDDTGGLVECTATASHRIHGAQQEYRWTWFDGVEASGPAIQRRFAEDGEYAFTLTATAPDGWQVEQQGRVLVSECGKRLCMELVRLGEDDTADVNPGDTIRVQLDLTNVGSVALTDYEVSYYDLPAELHVEHVPSGLFQTIAPGEHVVLDTALSATGAGLFNPSVLVEAEMPSGRTTSVNLPVGIAVGGGDLRVSLDPVAAIPVGESVTVPVKVRNDGDLPITEVHVNTSVDEGSIVSASRPEQSLDIDPGSSVTFAMTLTGWAEGTAHLHLEAGGIRDERSVVDRETVEIGVGGANPIVVDSTGDEPDTDANDHRCDVDAATDGDQCTLRAAVQEANSRGGLDTIAFGIEGAGTHTITTTGLARLEGATVIDGTTQPGYADRPVVELVGPHAIGVVGIDSNATIVVRGLSIGGFSAGIDSKGPASVIERNSFGLRADGHATERNGTGVIATGDATEVRDNVFVGGDDQGLRSLGAGNVVVRNIFGLDHDEHVSAPNTVGIFVNGRDSTIGRAGEGNVVANSTVDGIDLGPGADGTHLVGNIVGTNHGSTLTAILAGSGRRGISMVFGVDGVVIGGPGPADGNVVVQSGDRGIFVGSEGAVVQGNWIGTPPQFEGQAESWFNAEAGVDQVAARGTVIGNHFGANGGQSLRVAHTATGTVVQANTFTITSVAMTFAGDALVGGPSAADGNRVVDGFVTVDLDAHVRFVNTTFSDATTINGPALDLLEGSRRGVTENDAGDADTGPNGLQNFPTLTSARLDGGSLLLTGRVDGAAAATSYAIEVFATHECNASGHGPGEVVLGHGTVTGAAPFSLTLTRPDAGYRFVTATATGPDGTSEFSACAPLASGTSLSAAVPAGATTLPVVSNAGFSVGGAVAIDPGTASAEFARITGFGSLLLDRPLRFAHSAGTVIEALPADTDLAPACPARQLTTAEDTPLTASLACVDEQPSTLHYTLAGAAPPGLTSGPTGLVSYAPPANFSGTVTFSFLATDAASHASAPTTVTITVTPVNDPPTCAAVSGSGTVGQPVPITPACSDVDSTQLSYAVVTQPVHGSVAVDGGRLVATMTAAGTETFTYRASDGQASSAPATATVSVVAAPAGGLSVGVDTAVFVTDRRLPSVFLLAGTMRALPGATPTCGEAVTLSFNGRFTQTIPAGAMRMIGRVCTQVSFPRSSLLSALTFDLGRGTWSAAGLGAPGALAGLTNPVTIRLAIGGDAGSATVRARGL